MSEDATDQAGTDGRAPTPAEVQYSISGGLAAWLGQHKLSIAASSYQSGLLYLIGRNAGGGINVHQTALAKPMGLATVGETGFLLSADFQILRFENTLRPGQAVNDQFDACYVPRVVHVTGRLDAHDVGLGPDDLPIFVNTRFNCLARPSARHSFEPVWRPPFVSSIVDEDRCHLNGLAMEGTRPRYVTAVSRSDTIDGWRDRRADGGIVVDVETGEIVCEGLSMPHSPRLHQGRLWVLNSGTGELGYVDLTSDGKGRFEPVAFCPGFVRGLSFWGDFAIVGLSKPRYKRFEGLALDQRLTEADSEPWCGIHIIDLKTGACAHWFRIDGPVAELYDVTILPNAICPMAVSPVSAEAAGLITHADMTAALDQVTTAPPEG